MLLVQGNVCGFNFDTIKILDLMLMWITGFIRMIESIYLKFDEQSLITK